MADRWVDVCSADDILEEDVYGFEDGRRSYAVFRGQGNQYTASDGLCTHEEALLSEGFVIDGLIECPLHNGRFSIKTGKAMGAPACVDLKMYPVKIEAGRIWVNVGG